MKLWKNAGAVAGLAIVGLLVCGLLWVALAPHARVPTGDQPTERPDRAYEAGGTQCDPARLRAIPSPEQREAAATDCAQTKEQHRAQQSDLDQQTRAANAGEIVAWFAYDQTRIAAAQAVLSVVGTLFTALAAWAAVIAARAAQTSIQEARDTSKTELRAYLSVEAGGWVSQSHQTVFEFRPRIVNSGHTPARKVRHSSEIELLPCPIPDGFDFTLPRHSGAAVTSIASNKETQIIKVMNRRLTDAEVSETFALNGRRLHIWGDVIYEDVFGREWHSEYHYWIAWTPDGPLWMSSDRNNACT